MLATRGIRLCNRILYRSSDLPLVAACFPTRYAEVGPAYVEHAMLFHLRMSDTLGSAFCRESAVPCPYVYIDMGIHYEGWDQEDVWTSAGYGISDDNAAEGIFKAGVEEPCN